MTPAHGGRARFQAPYGGARDRAAAARRLRLKALILAATGGAALLGALAVVVVVHAAHEPRLLTGGTLVALCVFGVVLAVIPVAALAAVRTLPEAEVDPPLPRGAVQRPAAPAYQPSYEPSYPDVPSGPQPPAYPPPPAPAPAQSQAQGQGQAQAQSQTQNPASAAAGASTRPSGMPQTAGGEEVLVHLSRRLQSLVHRQIELLDTLENEVEEPDLLKGLFGVDHLATRIRRHAENLAVLGGTVARRQWTRPVSIMEILRSAVSETLEYTRVQVVPRAPGHVNGYAVADVVHLLAELVENATSFSPPNTRVVLRAYPLVAGLAIEVDDRGLGMPQADYQRFNELLREPVGISVQELLEGGRIGLYVVAQLARRHGIAVALQPNITGGIQALAVLPPGLLAVIEPRPVERRSPEQQTAIAGPLRAAPVLPLTASPTVAALGGGLGNAGGFGTGVGPGPGAATASGGVRGSGRMHEAAGGSSAGSATGSGSVYRGVGVAARGGAQGNEGFAESGPHVPGPRGERPVDVWPPLPTRRPQEHLAASLFEAPDPPADRIGEIGAPTMTTDFRRGLRRGSTPPWPASPSDGQAQTSESDT